MSTRKIFAIFILVVILSFGIIMIIYYGSSDFGVNIFLQLFVILFYVLILIDKISIVYVNKKYATQKETDRQRKPLNSKQELEMEYYSQIKIMNDNYKEFIHNSIHYLKVIGELAQQKNFEKILSILNEMHIQSECNEMIVYSHNPVLNAILSEKRSQAQKSNIEYDVYVEPAVELLGIPDGALISMIGNLLDNAIRAAEKCVEVRKVSVRIFMQNKGDFIIIKIVNSFSKINIRKGKLNTTKKSKHLHGIGIASVKNNAVKFGGFLENFIEKNNFISILVLHPVRNKTASTDSPISVGREK